MSVTRAFVSQTIVETLAAELSCDPSQLGDGSVHVVTLRARRAEAPMHRAWPPVTEPQLRAVSMTHGGVVAVSSRWRRWAVRHWEGVSSAVHAAQLAPAVARAGRVGLRAYGPRYHFTLDEDSWRRVAPPDGVEIAGERGRGATRYRARRWPNAWVPSAYPVSWSATARRSGRLIGVATSVIVNPALAEVGVDVLAGVRGAGVGAALVSALTLRMLEAGEVPLYATSPANIRSMRTATRVGFAPAFAEFATLPGVDPALD